MSALSSGGWAGMTSIDDINARDHGTDARDPGQPGRDHLRPPGPGRSDPHPADPDPARRRRRDRRPLRRRRSPASRSCSSPRSCSGRRPARCRTRSALLARTRETLIAVSQGIILPMTFLSTTFMVPAAHAGLDGHGCRVQPADAGPPTSLAPRSTGRATSPTLGVRLGWLAIFLVVSAVLALGAFGRYRRAIHLAGRRATRAESRRAGRFGGRPFVRVSTRVRPLGRWPSRGSGSSHPPVGSR